MKTFWPFTSVSWPVGILTRPERGGHRRVCHVFPHSVLNGARITADLIETDRSAPSHRFDKLGGEAFLDGQGNDFVLGGGEQHCDSVSQFHRPDTSLCRTAFTAQPFTLDVMRTTFALQKQHR